MMQEAVRLDLEDEAARPGPPLGAPHRAAVIVVGRRGPADGEAAKAVLAHDARRTECERGRASSGRCTTHSVRRRKGEAASSSVPT